MLSRSDPEVVDFEGGCVIDFLDEAGRSTALLACGECALRAFNDADRITNVVSGFCENPDYRGDKMTTDGEDEL